MPVLARKHTSKTAITTSNKVKMTSPLSPDVPISHHFPKGKQTGPCTCSALSLPGGGRLRRVPAAGPDGVPLPRAPTAPIQVALRTWRRCPPQQEASEARRAGRRVGAIAPGSASGSCAPSAAARAPITALLPGWGCGVSGPGSGPCLGAKGSDLVSQQSLLVTAIRAKASAAGSPGRAGAGPGPARQLDARVSQLGDAGLRNRFFPKQTENR